jgi:hypothetical protein
VNSSQNLVGKLVLIDGIVARPELNGQLGLVRAYHDEKGRCEVRLVSDNIDSNKSLALKPERLLDWAAQPIATTVEDETETAKKIQEASASKLLGYWRDDRLILRPGGTATKKEDVVSACIERNLRLPMATTGEELMRGGIIEMMVQAIDAQMDNRGMLWWLLNVLGMTLLGGTEPRTRFTLNSRMKDRAIEAGAVDRIGPILLNHKTADVQCSALSLIYAMATGFDCPETKARRTACESLIPDIITAMELAPHKSAIQHYGIQALGTICDGGACSNWLDRVIAHKGHLATLEAMRRHGHVVGENGACDHRVETEEGIANATMRAPGSILLAGCQLLAILVMNEDGQKDRVDALNEAGSLSVIASAIRANPSFSTDEGLTKIDLVGAPFLVPLVATLCGKHRPLNEIVPEEDDRVLLVGEVAREGDQSLEKIMSGISNPTELGGLLGASYMSFMMNMAQKQGRFAGEM